MTTTGSSSSKKRVFSGRHVRGWLATAIILSALAFTVRSVCLGFHLAAAGDVKHLFTDQSLPWIVAMYALAVVVASSRASGFVFEVGHKLAVKLHLTGRKAKKDLVSKEPDDSWAKELQPRNTAKGPKRSKKPQAS